MLSSLYRCLIRVTEKVHDPKRPRARVLSRRSFTRALAVVAFGGVARPASPRVLSNRACECDPDGQCTGGCQPNYGFCYQWGSGQPLGLNCWCELAGENWAHVCDCHCPGAKYPYCSCYTIGYAGCDLGWT